MNYSLKKDNRGSFGDVIGIILIVLFTAFSIWFVFFLIKLPSEMQAENKEIKRLIKEKGIEKREVLVKSKEIYESTDADGGSTYEYYVYFEGGRIENSSLYNRVKVGDMITVYTVDGSHFKLDGNPESFLHSDFGINLAQTVSNAIIALLLSIVINILLKSIRKNKKSSTEPRDTSYLISTPYDKINRDASTDYDEVNTIFLNHMFSNPVKGTFGILFFILLIVSQVIAIAQTSSPLPVVAIIAAVTIFMFLNSKSKKKAEQLNLDRKNILASNYYIITGNVVNLRTKKESAGEDDVTCYYMQYPNGTELTCLSSFFSCLSENAVVHYFVVGNNLTSTCAVIKKYRDTPDAPVLVEDKFPVASLNSIY